MKIRGSPLRTLDRLQEFPPLVPQFWGTHCIADKGPHKAKGGMDIIHLLQSNTQTLREVK